LKDTLARLRRIRRQRIIALLAFRSVTASVNDAVI